MVAMGSTTKNSPWPLTFLGPVSYGRSAALSGVFCPSPVTRNGGYRADSIGFTQEAQSDQWTSAPVAKCVEIGNRIRPTKVVHQMFGDYVLD
jgi:hypothetical protein